MSIYAEPCSTGWVAWAERDGVPVTLEQWSGECPYEAAALACREARATVAAMGEGGGA